MFKFKFVFKKKSPRPKSWALTVPLVWFSLPHRNGFHRPDRTGGKLDRGFLSQPEHVCRRSDSPRLMGRGNVGGETRLQEMESGNFPHSALSGTALKAGGVEVSSLLTKPLVLFNFRQPGFLFSLSVKRTLDLVNDAQLGVGHIATALARSFSRTHRKILIFSSLH